MEVNWLFLVYLKKITSLEGEMHLEQINKTIGYAQHFIDTANEARKRLKEDNQNYFISGTKESSACRRASMELTRELSKLRG
jgi:hypothetical protein